MLWEEVANKAILKGHKNATGINIHMAMGRL